MKLLMKQMKQIFEAYANKAAKYKVASSIVTNLLREKSQKISR